MPAYGERVGLLSKSANNNYFSRALLTTEQPFENFNKRTPNHKINCNGNSFITMRCFGFFFDKQFKLILFFIKLD